MAFKARFLRTVQLGSLILYQSYLKFLITQVAYTRNELYSSHI